MLLKIALEAIKISPSSQIQDLLSAAVKILKNNKTKTKYVTDRIKMAVRTGPGSDEKVIAVVQNGQEFEIIEPGEKWSGVKLNDNRQGWVLTRYIVQYPYALSGSPLKPGYRFYVTDKLRMTLREGPGTNHKILSIVESKQRVKIIFAGSEWSQVQAPDGKEGWVLSRYLIDYPADRWCVEGDCLNGLGRYIYSNGEKYEGDFRDGQRHGSGTIEYKNGAQYAGEFRNDQKHGTGTYKSPDGNAAIVRFDREKMVVISGLTGNKNEPDPRRDTAKDFEDAVLDGKITSVKWLLENGTDANTKIIKSWPALVVASHKGYTAIVQLLIESGAEVNARNKKNYTALLWASANSHMEIVKILLKSGADVNAAEYRGLTALMFAVDRENTKLVKLLLDHGADVNAEPDDGATPLVIVSHKGNLEIEKLLIEAGAKKDTRAGLMFEAVKNDNPELVKKFVIEGVPVNFKEEGFSALFYACKNKNYKLARWLIDHEAIIDPFSIFISDDGNHLKSYTDEQREFLAYLLYVKLSRKKYVLPKADAKSQVDFVKHIKTAIYTYLQSLGNWAEDAIGWSVRLSDVDYDPDVGGFIRIGCDVAIWTEGAMFEIASKSGMLQTIPQLKNSNLMSHGWLFVNGMLSTSYDENRVINGDFKVTRRSEDNFVARHVRK